MALFYNIPIRLTLHVQLSSLYNKYNDFSQQQKFPKNLFASEHHEKKSIEEVLCDEILVSIRIGTCRLPHFVSHDDHSVVFY